MIAGQLALTTAALFAGAALYINVAEQPARLGLNDAALLAEWKPAYKRGTTMQAPLAVISFLFGLSSWWETGQPAWAVGAVLMIANWPVTYFVILPINNRLLAIDPALADHESRALIERWGSLHAIRTGLGLCASLIFLTASLA